jgi:tRNA A37 threonylcarbamoyladenosine modification protein TsaB
MPKILSIYADFDCGYAAIDLGRTVTSAKHQWSRKNAQSTEFVPFLERVIKKKDVTSLDAIVAPRGPTSFTSTRIVLTIAKSILFCAKNASIFAPSHLHVLAFAAKDEIEKNVEFIVITDSMKQGFYGAIFYNRNDRPIMIQSPSFYSSETGVSFLKSNSSLPVVKDFTETSFCNNFMMYVKSKIIAPKVNLAEKQLHLYKSYLKEKKEEKPDVLSEVSFDFSTFSPFYLHSPLYIKM